MQLRGTLEIVRILGMTISNVPLLYIIALQALFILNVLKVTVMTVTRYDFISIKYLQAA
jgi:hypothetical protein